MCHARRTANCKPPRSISAMAKSRRSMWCATPINSGASVPRCTEIAGSELFHARKAGGGKKRARHISDDQSIRFAQIAGGDPFGIIDEGAPARLAVAQRVPGQEISQIIAGRADHGGPETGLADAMLLPDTQRCSLEALEQRRHAAGQAGIDAQFVNHRNSGSWTKAAP